MKPSIKSGIVLMIIVVAVFLVALNSKNEGMGGVSGMMSNREATALVSSKNWYEFEEDDEK